MVASLGLALAQSRFRDGFRFWEGNSGPIVRTEGGVEVNEDTVRTARETAPHSLEFPPWTNTPGFENDVFTFTRLIFKSQPGHPQFLGWVNDYPDGDLNLSYRLQQMTAFKADPDGRVLKMTDPALAEYPFVFMSHPEAVELADTEAHALGNYLLNGGSLMVDDIWGERNWQGFELMMKRVLPDRSWTELAMKHPIFHCVFDLHEPLSSLQVPTIHVWRRNYDPSNPGATSFGWRGAENMHVRAWLDDKGRIMVIATHNTDTGDGWEREGEDEQYFEQFAETRAYPLAINIIFYLMTH